MTTAVLFLERWHGVWILAVALVFALSVGAPAQEVGQACVYLPIEPVPVGETFCVEVRVNTGVQPLERLVVEIDTPPGCSLASRPSVAHADLDVTGATFAGTRSNLGMLDVAASDGNHPSFLLRTLESRAGGDPRVQGIDLTSSGIRIEVDNRSLADPSRPQVASLGGVFVLARVRYLLASDPLGLSPPPLIEDYIAQEVRILHPNPYVHFLPANVRVLRHSTFAGRDLSQSPPVLLAPRDYVQEGLALPRFLGGSHVVPIRFGQALEASRRSGRVRVAQSGDVWLEVDLENDAEPQACGLLDSTTPSRRAGCLGGLPVNLEPAAVPAADRFAPSFFHHQTLVVGEADDDADGVLAAPSPDERVNVRVRSFIDPLHYYDPDGPGGIEPLPLNIAGFTMDIAAETDKVHAQWRSLSPACNALVDGDVRCAAGPAVTVVATVGGANVHAITNGSADHIQIALRLEGTPAAPINELRVCPFIDGTGVQLAMPGVRILPPFTGGVVIPGGIGFRAYGAPTIPVGVDFAIIDLVDAPSGGVGSGRLGIVGGSQLPSGEPLIPGEPVGFAVLPAADSPATFLTHVSGTDLVTAHVHALVAPPLTGRLVSLTPEFSSDGGASWAPATAGVSGALPVATPSGMASAQPIVLTWDARADGMVHLFDAEDARLRVVARDAATGAGSGLDAPASLRVRPSVLDLSCQFGINFPASIAADSFFAWNVITADTVCASGHFVHQTFEDNLARLTGLTAAEVDGFDQIIATEFDLDSLSPPIAHGDAVARLVEARLDLVGLPGEGTVLAAVTRDFLTTNSYPGPPSVALVGLSIRPPGAPPGARLADASRRILINDFTANLPDPVAFTAVDGVPFYADLWTTPVNTRGAAFLGDVGGSRPRYWQVLPGGDQVAPQGTTEDDGMVRLTLPRPCCGGRESGLVFNPFTGEVAGTLSAWQDCSSVLRFVVQPVSWYGHSTAPAEVRIAVTGMTGLPACGDCDHSGTISVLDTLLAAQIASGLQATAAQCANPCDVDSSLSISVLDALRIAQSVTGLPVTLVCP